MYSKCSTNIAGAILAGGNNIRMKGKDKAFIRIGGSPIIKRSLNVLKGIFSEIIIVTNSVQEYEGYKKDYCVIPDLIKDIGPLGGIFSALSKTTKEAVFFVACDMPFLHNDIIRSQLQYFIKNDCVCLVPRIEGKIEPLHALYRTELKDNIQAFVENGAHHSIRDFLNTIETCYWKLEETQYNKKIFSNINTPEEMRQAGGVYRAGKIKDLAGERWRAGLWQR